MRAAIVVAAAVLSLLLHSQAAQCSRWPLALKPMAHQVDTSEITKTSAHDGDSSSSGIAADAVVWQLAGRMGPANRGAISSYSRDLVLFEQCTLQCLRVCQ